MINQDHTKALILLTTPPQKKKTKQKNNPASCVVVISVIQFYTMSRSRDRKIWPNYSTY